MFPALVSLFPALSLVVLVFPFALLLLFFSLLPLSFVLPRVLCVFLLFRDLLLQAVTVIERVLLSKDKPVKVM